MKNDYAVPLPMLLKIAEDLKEKLQVTSATVVTRDGDTWRYITRGGNLITGTYVAGIDEYGEVYQRVDFQTNSDD
jgi:hypothetical protein